MLLAGAGRHPPVAAIPEGGIDPPHSPAFGPFCLTKDWAGDDRKVTHSRAWIGVLLFPSPGEGLGRARLICRNVTARAGQRSSPCDGFASPSVVA
jgi:hypothetical protein